MSRQLPPNVLIYKYELICPKCKAKEYKYLVEKGLTIGSVDGCKCGYSGMIDLRCLGRYVKQYVAGWKGDLLNIQSITKRIADEE